MARVVVMRGLPGSGKGHYVSNVLASKTADILCCSADHFFIGSDGKYKFDPALLPQAHAECQRMFAYAVMAAYRDPELYPNQAIVVDNTNLSATGYTFYCTMATAFGLELEVVTVECDPAVAAARNTHGVPKDAYSRMFFALQKGTADLPPWWKHTLVKAGVVEQNQCDGCQAGYPKYELKGGQYIPSDTGDTHLMGSIGPGCYADPMSCTAHLYKRKAS